MNIFRADRKFERFEDVTPAILKKEKVKLLLCDLDNTLWGGVVGDDGVEGIQVGPEVPIGQVYSEFQSYVKELKSRLASKEKRQAAAGDRRRAGDPGARSGSDLLREPQQRGLLVDQRDQSGHE